MLLPHFGRGYREVVGHGDLVRLLQVSCSEVLAAISADLCAGRHELLYERVIASWLEVVCDKVRM